MKYRVEVEDSHTAWFADLFFAFKYFCTQTDFEVTDSPYFSDKLATIYRESSLTKRICWTENRHLGDPNIFSWYHRVFKLNTGLPKEEYEVIRNFLYWDVYGNEIARNKNAAKDWHKELIGC